MWEGGREQSCAPWEAEHRCLNSLPEYAGANNLHHAEKLVDFSPSTPLSSKSNLALSAVEMQLCHLVLSRLEPKWPQM